MKSRILAALTVAVVLGAAVFGILEKRTYTDISSKSDYMQYFQVAELPESLAESITANMMDTLPGSTYILRVASVWGIEHLFGINRQKVTVLEVYKGNGMQSGDTFYITSSSWSLLFAKTSGILSTEMGFVNHMENDKDYLVFLSEKIDTLDGSEVYRLADYAISPVFSYDDHENTIVETSGESTYVDYDLVSENEFFACTETALQYMLELKSAMLSLYPQN